MFLERAMKVAIISTGYKHSHVHMHELHFRIMSMTVY